MTCSPSNFPRGKKVDLHGTGTKVYADQYANVIIRGKIGIYKPTFYAYMKLVIYYTTITVK